MEADVIAKIVAMTVLLAASAASQAQAAPEHAHDGARSHPHSSAAVPAAMSEGEVRKVDVPAGKITLRHGRIENLAMPPMTMVFRVKDPAWLTAFKPGDKVRFVADRLGGDLTLIALEPAS